MDFDHKNLMERVLLPNRCVNSGVYTAIDPSLSTRINAIGEYEYEGLDASYQGPSGKLLAISALGGTGLSESAIAENLFGKQEYLKRHPIAGLYLLSGAGWVADPTMRATSSSGGLTTWLLTRLLKKGEVDGVIHLKQSEGNDSLFSYQISRTEKEVTDGAKTRYYPGELSKVLAEVASFEGNYALVGIPSLIYEVRLLQEIDPTFRDRIPYLIGLICGHQKTTKYTEYIGWRAGFKPGSIQSIDYRKKLSGVPSNEYSTEITGEIEGETITRIVRQTDLFGADWGLGFFKSNFSDFSEDAFNETADIVLGDAWLPEYVQDSAGTNIVLVRDERLRALVEEGIRDHEIHLDVLPVETVISSQSSLVRHAIEEISYRTSLLPQEMPGLNLTQRSGYKHPSPSFTRKMLQRIRLKSSRKSHDAYQAAVLAGSLDTFDQLMSPISASYYRWQYLDRIIAKMSQGPRAVIQASGRRLHKRIKRTSI